MLAVLSAVTYVAAGGLYFVLVQLQGGVTMPSFLVVFELLLGGMALCSAASVLVRSRSWRLGLLSTSTVAGLFLGVLGLFSLGLLVLLGGVIAGVAYARTLSWQRPRTGGVATLAGAAVAIAALGAVFVPTMVPGFEVDCQNGTVTNSGGWGFFGEDGGSTSATGGETIDGRTITGTDVVNGHTYHYTCRDGRLVKLTRKR